MIVRYSEGAVCSYLEEKLCVYLLFQSVEIKRKLRLKFFIFFYKPAQKIRIRSEKKFSNSFSYFIASRIS
ncbi:hypothetical protein SAMN06265367_102560 [Algoriphagus winogradskyi]|uniref:Uncharacterized protein n=1 Tax=Algoriphagus winogradskyi TaxID=237017 RepID=A0ABY1NRZ4_9BACT|nr:hypothetical protein SAMN06265367_102560 [Algoriphagus winogradskyi]